MSLFAASIVPGARSSLPRRIHRGFEPRFACPSPEAIVSIASRFPQESESGDLDMKFLTRSNLGAAISPRLSPLLATLVLGGSVLAGPSGEVKTPRVPSSGPTAKLPAPPIEKLPSTIATQAPAGTDAGPVQPRGSGLPVPKQELDRSQVFFSSETAGTVHARGAGYKARFGADGATY